MVIDQPDVERLTAIIRDLSSALDLTTIVNIVSQCAGELVQADGVTFVLREGGQVYYAEERAIGPLWKGRRFPAHCCISGWAMLNRQVVVIPDIYVDDRIPIDVYEPTFVKSLVMVPIRSTDPIGAIGAYWENRHEATAAEIARLQALADSASVAIANIELYESVRRAQEESEARAKEIAHQLCEKTKMEAALRESEHRFRAITEAAPVAIVITRQSDGLILYGNEQFSIFFREPIESLLNRRGLEFYVDPADRDKLLDLLAHNPVVHNYELQLKRADGTKFWASTSVHLTQVDGTPALLCAVADITANKEAEEALIADRQELRRLALELSRVQHRQQKELVTNLHDDLAQTLVLCKLHLERAQQHANEETRRPLHETKECLDEALTYTRTVIADIRPPFWGGADDLSTAMTWLVNKMHRHGLHVEVQDDGSRKTLDEEMLNLTYHAIQEFLFNVIKHANTRTAVISIQRLGQYLEATVTDKGVGFEVSRLPRPSEKGGFGLFSLHERLALVGGRCEIDSKPNQGTCAKILVPLTIEDAADGCTGRNSDVEDPTGRLSHFEVGHDIESPMR